MSRQRTTGTAYILLIHAQEGLHSQQVQERAMQRALQRHGESREAQPLSTLPIIRYLCLVMGRV